MDILDELDLLDDLPDASDISLDDILAEFATPGLFSAPVPDFVAEDIPMDFSLDEPIPQEDAVEDDFSLGDILMDFGTPTDDDGVKLYTPKSQDASADKESPVLANGNTVLFDPVSAPAAEQPVQQKKPRMTWKERLAAKKAAKAEKKAAKKRPVAPASQEGEAILEAEAAAELDAWLEANDDWFASKLEKTAEPDPVPEAPAAPEPAPAFEPLPVPEMPIGDVLFANLPPVEEEAPHMEISLDALAPAEEGEGDVSLDLTPDTPAAAEETPEEAEARRAKEDASLRYVPEESTAKTVTSAIGKRVASAFTAFSESGDGKRQVQEDDLGPELEPGKASRFFGRFLNGYRFRLRIATAMCVVLGWISLGLPVFGSLKNPAVAAAACLMLLLTVMLTGVDVFTAGVRELMQRKPGAHALLSLSCLGSVLDAVVIILSKGEAGYLPFCAVSAISVCFAIYGSLLYCRGQRMNFRALELSQTPMTIAVDYGMVDEETTTAYRTAGHPEGYVHRSEEEDLSESVHAVIAPMLIVAVPVLALLAALFGKSFGDFFHILSGMFAAAASFSALLAFPLPYFLVERELFHSKASIAGWAGARDLGRVSTMIVSDSDLFPDDAASISCIRIVDGAPSDLTLTYMCSIVAASKSCLVPAFEELAAKYGYEVKEIEDFTCHETGGLSGSIGPDNVLLGHYNHMRLEGYRLLPSKREDRENALFLAVNGHVLAYVVIDYAAKRSVRLGLDVASKGSAEMVFTAPDFNVTPLLITKKFKTTTDMLRFPTYKQVFEITDRADGDSAVCAGFVPRKSFYAYAVLVQRARSLYRAVSINVALSAVSSLIGILMVFFMAVTGTGAAVTVGRLLIYMLPWLFPTLAFGSAINQ